LRDAVRSRTAASCDREKSSSCAITNFPASGLANVRAYGVSIILNLCREKSAMCCHHNREEISRGLAGGLLYKEIGVLIGRDPSIISRDVARHGGRAGYRAVAADTTAAISRARPKFLAVERSPRLRQMVTDKLRSGWSPASIAGRLPSLVPDDQACRVSHEAIYQWVYAQPVSTLARELTRLRTGRPARRSGPRPQPQLRIREPRYLDERPAEVQGRAGPGRAIGRVTLSSVRTARPPPPPWSNARHDS
jgi:IS30 family transposase